MIQFSNSSARCCVNRLLKLRTRDSRLQAQGDLRSRLGVRDVPALGLAAGLTGAVRRFVIGVNLHRKLFMGEEKLGQQREASGVVSGFPYQFPAILSTQLSQRFSLVKGPFATLLLSPVSHDSPIFSSKRWLG